MIDTNAYADFMRGEAWQVAFSEGLELFLPLMAVAELRAGFRAGTQGKKNERNLLAFIASDRVKVVAPDDATTHHYASLYLQLRKQGTPIPINDLLIASLAVQYGAWLCTSDAHYDHLPQIPRCEPE